MTVMSPSLFEVLVRCLSDELPQEPTEIAFLFSETPDNEASVIQSATDLLSSGMTESVAVLDSYARCGYGGSARWLEAFACRGVRPGRIKLVPTAGLDILHTGTEAATFIDWAEAHGIRSAYAVAAPFHQVRAFITLVSAMRRASIAMRLYSFPGTPLDWQAVVVHSQGTLIATRAELIHSELERIDRYRSTGDLSSDEDIITYLNERRLVV
jgi:hypothetical protein